MKVQTDRLLIRPFQSSDCEEVFAYLSDEETMYYLPEGPFDEEATRRWITSREKDGEAYAVVLRESGRVVGHVVFERYFGDHTYEIGWIFHRSVRNRGIATEAARAVIAYAFEEKALHRIVATCQPENVASYRVMEKLGMRREGSYKQCIPHGDTWWDEYSYAILRSEYERANDIARR